MFNGIEPPTHRIDATGIVCGGVREKVGDKRVTCSQIREHARHCNHR